MRGDALDAAARAGAALAEALAPGEGEARSTRIGTLVSVDASGLASVRLAGGLLEGLPATTGAAAARPGDRVVVETFGSLAVVTGALAAPGAATAEADLVLPSGFSSYSDAQRPRAVRVGPLVYVTGAVKNASAIPYGDGTVVARVPAGFRPAAEFRTVQQASVRAHFLLKVDAEGDVSLARHEQGGAAAEVAAGSWINLCATYLTLDPMP